jgi:hypothetical protein
MKANPPSPEPGFPWGELWGVALMAVILPVTFIVIMIIHAIVSGGD